MPPELERWNVKIVRRYDGESMSIVRRKVIH